MTRRVASRVTVVGLVAVASAVSLMKPAAADAPKVRSTVHMHAIGPDPEYDHWVGGVHSRKRKCQRGRTVTVYYEETPAPERVDSDQTDRFGHWQVLINVLGTDDPYYAVVSRKVVGSGDNRIICKPDRSPDFGLPDSP